MTAVKCKQCRGDRPFHKPDCTDPTRVADSVTAISVARHRRVHNEISDAIMKVVERDVESANDPKEISLILAGITLELADALCTLIDNIDDRSGALTSPAIMRDFLVYTAEILEGHAVDRDDHQVLGVKVLRSTAAQLRDCAKGLGDCSDLVVGLVLQGKKP